MSFVDSAHRKRNKDAARKGGETRVKKIQNDEKILAAAARSYTKMSDGEEEEGGGLVRASAGGAANASASARRFDEDDARLALALHTELNRFDLISVTEEHGVRGCGGYSRSTASRCRSEKVIRYLWRRYGLSWGPSAGREGRERGLCCPQYGLTYALHCGVDSEGTQTCASCVRVYTAKLCAPERYSMLSYSGEAFTASPPLRSIKSSMAPPNPSTAQPLRYPY